MEATTACAETTSSHIEDVIACTDTMTVCVEPVISCAVRAVALAEDTMFHA